MREKVLDLIYAARQLCEVLNDRQDITDKDEDLKDCLEEVETALETLSEYEDLEDST